MGFITFIGTIIIWFIGGGEVLRNPEFTIGALTVFQSCMMQFYAPVQSLAQLNERFQHAATSAERVFEILDNKPEIADKENAIELPDIKGHIQFKNVTFSYDGEQDALDDVSFDVQPGEMIGLAGHTGAGKTTLINLLCRFYDINKGAILVDGHDIRDIKIESLRSQIGVVLQNPFLFNGTVAENIAYGKPGATMREVIAAAKAANAHEFIMNFPDGYDTVVGERGERVSGGERQRISIARAILKDPRILILDEATSSVDTETESTIQEALVRLIKGRTVFAIAHRLSTLKHSNRLLILEKGKLAEIGTHNELIEMDGIYAKLCKMQTELSKIRAW
jgi:ATP-binding cassette subfamily B protein